MGGRAVECDGLENRCGGNSTGGSNPSPSARRISARRGRLFFIVLTSFISVIHHYSVFAPMPSCHTFICLIISMFAKFLPRTNLAIMTVGFIISFKCIFTRFRMSRTTFICSLVFIFTKIFSTKIYNVVPYFVF